MLIRRGRSSAVGRLRRPLLDVHGGSRPLLPLRRGRLDHLVRALGDRRPRQGRDRAASTARCASTTPSTTACSASTATTTRPGAARCSTSPSTPGSRSSSRPRWPPARSPGSAALVASAAPIRSTVDGWVAEQACVPARRVGVGEVRAREAPLEVDQRRRVVGELERERRRRSPRPCARAGCRGSPSTNAASGDREQVGRHRRRASPGRRPDGGRSPAPARATNSSPSGATIATKARPAADVVVGDVAELVGDDRAQLRPLGLARAGCRRGRPAWSSRSRRRRRSARSPAGWRRPGRPRRSRPRPRSPSSSTSARARLPSGSGSNLLKIGASTTGAIQTKTDGEPGDRPRARASTSRAGSGGRARSGAPRPPAVISAAIAGRPGRRPRARSPSDWVERPTSTARSCGDQAAAAGCHRGRQQRDRGAGDGGAEQRACGEPLEPAAHRRRAPERDATSTAPSTAEPADHQPALAVAVVVRRARARPSAK